MIQICSYCKINYGEKEPYDDRRLTHGICRSCHDKLVKEVKNFSYDDFLESFGLPVLIIDSLGRVHAANQCALKAIKKPFERVKGLLEGDAVECSYANISGGCGQSNHCPACTIRNLVMDTLVDKRQKYKEPVSIKTNEKIINGYVSTVLVDEAVCIIFEEYFLEVI